MHVPSYYPVLKPLARHAALLLQAARITAPNVSVRNPLWVYQTARKEHVADHVAYASRFFGLFNERMLSGDHQSEQLFEYFCERSLLRTNCFRWQYFERDADSCFACKLRSHRTVTMSQTPANKDAEETSLEDDDLFEEFAVATGAAPSSAAFGSICVSQYLHCS